VRDFSFDAYKQLIGRLREAGYGFQTFGEFIASPLDKVVLIRHDIDVAAVSALRFAKMERELNINASYYFRMIKFVYQPKIIREVANLGHEVGYHYEDLSRNNGNMAKALQDFEYNLSLLRQIYPVKTICMHGSSGSPFDNREMWNLANMKDYNIIAEPYLSLDFNKVLYMSDTSQCWNGSNVALRDKVKSTLDISFRTTWDIIKGIDKLPDQVMLTIHPELWTNSLIGWLGIRSVFFAHSYYKTHFRNRRTLQKQKVRSGDSNV
jgi:hypothetical protein